MITRDEDGNKIMRERITVTQRQANRDDKEMRENRGIQEWMT